MATRLNMRMLRYNDRGDTLIEILMAVVLIGVIFSGFVIALETNSTTSSEHRNLVTADALLRDYAEATKAAVRHDCNVASPTTYATTTTSVAGIRFNSASTPAGQNCPAPTTVQRVDLTVTVLPNGPSRTLSIDVRTP
jgi:prepilin-type N-terminal cleavage/methylation domain-containing protein